MAETLKKTSPNKLIYSSARRYLRFGNPASRKYAAASWTFKKLGIRDLDNFDKSLQKTWLDLLGEEDINFKDQIISLYFAYLDLLNYHSGKLINQLFDLHIVSRHRPVGEIDEGYYALLLQDNYYETTFLKEKRLGSFSLEERFYFSLMMSHPLPWTALAKAIRANLSDLPNRFKRLIALFDYIDEDLSKDLLLSKLDSLDDIPDFELLFYKLSQVSQANRISLKTPLPEKMILLVEGSTEEIVLPHLAKCMGIDFNELGIKTISVGGKNQILKHYSTWSEYSRLPVRVVLDSDAQEQADEIKDILRAEDKIFLLKDGEFEDCFSIEAVIDLCNQIILMDQDPLNIEEFDLDARRTHDLNKIWRSRGLGDFDKVLFAEAIVDYIDSKSQVPRELQEIISEILI